MDQVCDRPSGDPEVTENGFAKTHIFRPVDNSYCANGDSSNNNDSMPPAYLGSNHTAPEICPAPKPKPLTRKVGLRDQISIIIGPPAVLLFDLVAPCLIYYIWLNRARSRWRDDCAPFFNTSRPCPIPRPVYNAHILGTSIVFFGIGELYMLLARVYRLVRYHNECAPLLSTRRWQLDATAWVYGVALLVSLVPFVVSTSVDQGIYWLFLYAPGFLIAFLEICAIVTLFPIKFPVQINSDPPYSPLKPIVYYAAEDFMAVDGCQGRGFRRRYQARYQASADFRRMILELTLFWIAGCTIYLGCVSAIIWNLQFEFAFGSTLGLLFFWVILWASLTVFWVKVRSHT